MIRQFLSRKSFFNGNFKVLQILSAHLQTLRGFFFGDTSGTTTQSCTINGETLISPCINRVVETSWPSAGVWAVTLAASLQGSSAVTTVIDVTVTSSFSPPSGSSVARNEIRTLSLSGWNTIVNALYVLKNNGVHDHFVYLHEVRNLPLFSLPFPASVRVRYHVSSACFLFPPPPR